MWYYRASEISLVSGCFDLAGDWVWRPVVGRLVSGGAPKGSFKFRLPEKKLFAHALAWKCANSDEMIDRSRLGSDERRSAVGSLDQVVAEI
jgi:hypothetical protein